MKSPIVVLPVLLQIALVVALCTQSSSTPVPAPVQAPLPLSSAAEGSAEITQLHHQREQIEARLAALESRTTVFLPRGMGGVADGAPPPPTPSPDVPNLTNPGIQTPAR
jgi:hypothetical protein